MIDYERVLKEIKAFREIAPKIHGSLRLVPYTLVHLHDDMTSATTYNVAPSGGNALGGEASEIWELLAVHSFMQGGCVLIGSNGRVDTPVDTTLFKVGPPHPVFHHRVVTAWDPLVLTLDVKWHTTADIVLVFRRHAIETLVS